MSGRIAARLAELGLELPTAAKAVAAYVPYVISGQTLYLAGQLPLWNGEKRYPGKVGAEVSLEDGYAAARLAGLNVLAQLQAATGDLDRVARFLKVNGFVNAGPDFHDHPRVINGASELFAEVFGAAGAHARTAVGVSSLPFNLAVEIDAVVELR